MNRPYHRMRLTVFFGFGFPFLLQWHGRTSLRLQPVLFMVIMWLLIQSVLLAITGPEELRVFDELCILVEHCIHCLRESVGCCWPIATVH